jgi:hypothetical protein
MRHGDRELFFIGQGLQGLLPQLVARPIAAAPIGGDEEVVCLGKKLFAIVLLPPPDALHRKLCCLRNKQRRSMGAPACSWISCPFSLHYRTSPTGSGGSTQPHTPLEAPS